MSTIETLPYRSLAAEARATEAGRHAIALPDGSIKVVSESVDQKWYRVTFTALRVGGPIQFTCCPQGRQAFKDDHMERTERPGFLGCLHSARAALRLEREGLAKWVHGQWIATDRAALGKRLPVPEDPFQDLV